MIDRFSTKEAHFAVLMMPDYRAINPYQDLLADAVRSSGIKVDFVQGYRRIFPIFRALKLKNNCYQVLHLHWISPYLKGQYLLVRLFYSFKFILDILLVRWSGIKIVWTIHNQVSHESTFSYLERWTRCILSQLVDQVILHHNSMVQPITDDYQFSPDKVSVIPIGHYRDIYPNAIDTQTARKILGLPLSGLVYVNQGVIRPYKG
ncbi:MAG: glycosyltransferase, partial [Bacteroidota bacterium]